MPSDVAALRKLLRIRDRDEALELANRRTIHDRSAIYHSARMPRPRRGCRASWRARDARRGQRWQPAAAREALALHLRPAMRRRFEWGLVAVSLYVLSLVTPCMIVEKLFGGGHRVRVRHRVPAPRLAHDSLVRESILVARGDRERVRGHTSSLSSSRSRRSSRRSRCSATSATTSRSTSATSSGSRASRDGASRASTACRSGRQRRPASSSCSH